jgi:hypothetical protein
LRERDRILREQLREEGEVLLAVGDRQGRRQQQERNKCSGHGLS